MASWRSDRLARVPHVGSRVKRPDDPRILSGRARYVDDLALPRMVHVAFVRSAHPHARLARVDLEAARRALDVVGVLTGAEAARLCKPYRGVLLHYTGMKTGVMLPLALERVRYVGEPIVALAATSRAAAEDAAQLVAVEYEPLAAVLDPDAARGPGAPLIHPELGDNVMYQTRLASGDPDAAFATAHRVWRKTFRIGRHTGVPIEPRSLVADYEPFTRALTLWTSTQVPHMMQAVVADLFGLPEHRVRVVAPAVGESFGIKIHVYQDDMAACALALVLARAVKFVATRRESFLSDIHAREQTVAVEVAAAADGTLAVVAQNKVVTSQYRAVGYPIATAVTESMVELIARDLGLGPAEMRRRNLVRPDELPYTSATGNVYDSGSYHAALERLLEVAGYDALRREQAAARAAGRAVGIGLSCFIELTGPGAQFYGVGGAPISGQEGTTVRIEPSGTVTVLTGLTDQGQGMRTALAQIVADALAVSVESISVVSGDTAVVPYGGGTWASRGMPIGGSATLLAGQALRDRVRRVAAALLEAHEDDVELRDGTVLVRGSADRALTLAELAATVHFRSNALRGLEPSLEATVHYANPAPWTFTNGAHRATVEVDRETGSIRVLKYVAVDDCGRLVHPALVDGQVRGGVAQGIGGALWEHCVYDGAGQLLTTTLMDYAVPTAADLPPIEVQHLETPAPSGAGGYKGAGEGGTAGAPAAILNAVNDALAPFGVMLTEQPLTPERVRRALQGAR